MKITNTISSMVASRKSGIDSSTSVTTEKRVVERAVAVDRLDQRRQRRQRDIEQEGIEREQQRVEDARPEDVDHAAAR